MNTSPMRLAAVALFALFIVGACAGDTGAQWTYAPVAITGADTAGGNTAATGNAASEQTAAAGEQTAAPDHGDMAPAGTEAPAQAPTESAASEPAGPAGGGEARVIEMVATGALQFTDPAGEQIRDIAVTPGETIIFRVDNTAGFDHDFYIGTDEELMVPNAVTDVGIPTWQSGVQELEWVVPADISGLKFGCTVPGHYALMQGTFSVAT
jgi:uncharacterized cupredoxin-like copper-binding protein